VAGRPRSRFWACSEFWARCRRGSWRTWFCLLVAHIPPPWFASQRELVTRTGLTHSRFVAQAEQAQNVQNAPFGTSGVAAMGSSLTDGTMLHRESRGAAEVRQGTACRACGPMEAEPTTKGTGTVGEETGWAAYLFFSFASSRLSAAELMQ